MHIKYTSNMFRSSIIRRRQANWFLMVAFTYSFKKVITFLIFPFETLITMILFFPLFYDEKRLRHS